MKKRLKIMGLFCFLGWISLSQVCAKDWVLSSKSAIRFDIKSLGMSVVSGQFTKYQSKMNFEINHPESASAEFILDVESIDINRTSLRTRIMGENLFYVAKYKTISFKSIKFKSIGDQQYNIHGILTIRGISKPVIFNTTLKPKDDAVQKIDVNASTIIRRSDFGMKPAVAGVGEKVTIQVKGTWIKD
jgi:polyisoprenoid-binding protein YceI